MPPVKPPADLPVVIHALLKPRWEWQLKQRRFATETRKFVAEDQLPAGAEISHLVERLQKVADAKRSAAEKKLARWVQIKLPPRSNVDAALREISSWPSVAEAHVVPPPSLPDTMAAPLA